MQRFVLLLVSKVLDLHYRMVPLGYQRGSAAWRQCGEKTALLMSTRKQETQEGASTPILRAPSMTRFLSLAPSSADHNTSH